MSLCSYVSLNTLARMRAFSLSARRDRGSAVGEGVKNSLVYFYTLTPSLCEDFPYLVSLAGAEKYTIVYRYPPATT